MKLQQLHRGCYPGRFWHNHFDHALTLDQAGALSSRQRYGPGGWQEGLSGQGTGSMRQ